MSAAQQNTPQSLSLQQKQQAVFLRLALISLCSGLLSGCSSPVVTVSPTAYAKIDGNWQFSSNSPAAALLPSLAGNLTSNGATLSGVLHPLALAAGASNSLCAKSSEAFPVTGNIDGAGNATLVSTGFSGGALSLKGTVAPGPQAQQTLLNATYSISGGPCAMSESPVAAAEYMPISGTYTGTIQSVSGASAVVTTTFTQSSAPDANGTFHLQGAATFGSAQSCLTQPVVSDSTVTGSMLTATYTQAQNGSNSSIAVAGTFNPSATTLTLTSYAIRGGPCDGDTGSGILTLQR